MTDRKYRFFTERKGKQATSSSWEVKRLRSQRQQQHTWQSCRREDPVSGYIDVAIPEA